METDLRTKYHNPNIREGARVISQYLDDENEGLSLDVAYTGRYRLKNVGITVELVSETGHEALEMELDNFMRDGILGLERFTVVPGHP